VRILRTTISCGALALSITFHLAIVEAEGLIFPLQVRWTASFEAALSFPPAYDATQAYVALRNHRFGAVSIADGEPAWSVECPITTAPAAGDGLAFAGGDGFVQAHAQSDGKVQWRTALDGVATSLFWDTGWLIATTDTGALLAIRAIDGEVLWKRALGLALQSAPAPAGDRLYLSLHDGSVMALSLKTGESIWTTHLPKPAAGILALDDRLYLGSQDNKFYCLSTKKGSIIWSWRTGADVIGMPAIDTEHVYFISLDNVLRALDRKSGSLRWMRSLPMRPSSGPLLEGWTIVVPGVAAELHAYSAVNGTPIGDLVLLSELSLEMQLAAPLHLTGDNLLIVATKGGQMQAFAGAPAPYGP
jgi:outer membrane protein assembly factor BamB